MSSILNPAWWFGGLAAGFSWWLVCLLASLACLPLVLRLFRGLGDRGASLAPAAGIALATYLTWNLSLGWFTSGSRFAIARLGLVTLAAAVAAIVAWRSTLTHPQSSLRNLPGFIPAGVLLIAALVHLPFSGFCVWLSILFVGVISASLWISEPHRLARELRRLLIPILASQLLFLVGFIFFLNVRSYVPAATYEISNTLWGSEKFGNLTHLNSVMRSSSLPPSDAWFLGEPINYYYGGHLTVAVLAKASGKPANEAFNFGLATVFGLTLSTGFAFVFNLMHRLGPKGHVRRIARFRDIGWGIFGAIAITFFGNIDPIHQLFSRDVAGIRDRVTLRIERDEKLLQLEEAGDLKDLQKQFGDWQLAQFTGRAASDPKLDVAKDTSLPRIVSEAALSRLSPNTADRARKAEVQHIANWRSGPLPTLWLGEDLVSILASDPAMSAEDMELVRYRLTALRQLSFTASNANRFYDSLLEKLPMEKQQELAAQRQTISSREVARAGALRFSTENLAQIDFWRSSRAIKGALNAGQKTLFGGLSGRYQSSDIGTITEFPYFSAILGDMHPHHMAIPYSLLILCAALSLMQKSSRFVSSDSSWWWRCAPDLAVMGVTIGMVFPVNIWDAVVMAPLLLIAILVALRGIRCSHVAWGVIGFAGMFTLLCLLVALLWNAQRGVAWLFGDKLLFVLALALASIGAGSWVWRRRFGSLARPVLLGTLILSVVCAAAGGATSAKSQSLQWSAELAAAEKAASAAAPEDSNEANERLASLRATAITSPVRAAMRDGAVFLLLGLIAAMWALGTATPLKAWWTCAGSAYAVSGILALFVILPFKLFFHSPIEKEGKLFDSVIPPVISHTLLEKQSGFWNEFWARSPVNPFEDQLRTTFTDYLTHWGLFVIPVFVLWMVRGIRLSGTWRDGRGFAFWIGLFGLLAWAINEMSFVTGPILLVLCIGSLIYALSMRHRVEGIVWAFVAIGFFFQLFVEVLHFDDSYSGYLERYNTPFKITYPLWAIFAGAMTFAFREWTQWFLRRAAPAWGPWLEVARNPMTIAALILGVLVVPRALLMVGLGSVGRIWLAAGAAVVALAAAAIILETIGFVKTRTGAFAMRTLRNAGIAAPALLTAAVVLVVGMLYPYSATATRTRSFFRDESAAIPWADEEYEEGRGQEYEFPLYNLRTLNGRAYMAARPAVATDLAAIEWLVKNVEGSQRILEVPGGHEAGSYTPHGRIAANTGLPTLVGWSHHERQWRGWTTPVPRKIAAKWMASYSIFDLKLTDLIPPGFPSEKLETFKAAAAAPMAERVKLFKEKLPELTEPEALAQQIEDQGLARINHSQLIDKMEIHADTIYSSPRLTKEVVDLLKFYEIRYIVVGGLERQKYPRTREDVIAGNENSSGLAKFDRTLKKVFDGGTAVYEVPADLKPEAEP